MEKTKPMTSEELKIFFRDFEDNKRKGLVLCKRKIGKTLIAGPASELESECESLNFTQYRYFFDTKPEHKVSKSIPITLTLWLDNYGKVIADRKTYSLLKQDKKLSIVSEKHKATYYDHFTNESELVDMSILEDFSSDDVNSLIVVHKFLSKISSGLRSPSDKDKASEMRYYLESLLSRNNINLWNQQTQT